ncbi:MAG: hypothetical protein LIP09_07555 [Bacteroidales bacterium]|nr:hypothetical protein [Bacteroidales bacterium]
MKLSPEATGLDHWVTGEVIDVEHNPFRGLVIAIRDNDGRIYFDQAKYFSIA